MPDTLPPPRVLDLGRLCYAEAYQVQLAHHAEILAARERAGDCARILLLEHDPPVITISRRPDARAHLLAAPTALAAAGIEVAETDRGGDITYHGPGQLVVYPIVDLNRLRLGLHDYMRLLEGAVIDTCDHFGIASERDPAATGVWIGRPALRANTPSTPESVFPHTGSESRPTPAKIAAMGVRVRRWVTLHGLALNITTNLDHFGLIVPCGLAGRPVTSLHNELGPDCPSMAQVKQVLASRLSASLHAAAAASNPPK